MSPFLFHDHAARKAATKARETRRNRSQSPNYIPQVIVLDDEEEEEEIFTPPPYLPALHRAPLRIPQPYIQPQLSPPISPTSRMVNIHVSYTALVNPPSATPVLTVPQIWAGLQRKIRHAEEFVPVIEECHVIEEDAEGVVTRQVKFKEGQGPVSKAVEVVRSYWPSWIDFEQADGSHIRNIVSDGPGFGPEQLHMTYTFEFRRPDLEEGEAADQAKEKMRNMAKMAVESSITSIRDMVKDGRIGAGGESLF